MSSKKECDFIDCENNAVKKEKLELKNQLTADISVCQKHIIRK